MRCPFCQGEESRVIDSRPVAPTIRRRRECESCHRRFNTVEMVEVQTPWIVKKDGRREVFSREKIEAGIRLACRKRSISALRIEEAVDAVASALLNSSEKEISTSEIGRLVLEELGQLDRVAWIRFASVYLEPESPEAFLDLARSACAEKPR
jgi:transcriptional repressor NrdR